MSETLDGENVKECPREFTPMTSSVQLNSKLQFWPKICELFNIFARLQENIKIQINDGPTRCQDLRKLLQDFTIWLLTEENLLAKFSHFSAISGNEWVLNSHENT